MIGYPFFSVSLIIFSMFYKLIREVFSFIGSPCMCILYVELGPFIVLLYLILVLLHGMC